MPVTLDTRGKSKSEGRLMGWLNWWTIHQGNYSEGDLRSSAIAAGIPQWMADRINGRSERSSWMIATQLGGRGIPSVSLPEEDRLTRARYLTRDLTSESRVIVREVTDENNERVSAETVAVVYLWKGGLTSEIKISRSEIEVELKVMLAEMKVKMSNLIGGVGDAKVRSLLLDWLRRRFRICVRGSGGVYLVPLPATPQMAQAVERELVQIKGWVSSSPLSSFFSIVELSDSGATTVEEFVQSAVEEVRADIEEVHQRMEAWAGNRRMNPGSKKYSAGEMVKRLCAIADKIETLKGALGEEVGVTEAMLEMVMAKARVMQDENAVIVTEAKAEREEAKAKKGLQGTAKQRAKQKKL